MIIASAIKFYIDKTDSEVILCGLRHGNIFVQLKNLGFSPRKGYKEICQGFLDNNGNFLDRYEAFIHAKNAGQIISNTTDNELYSEDLW